MGKCQSRCRFVVLMKNKPIKKGFKFYMVCCAFTGMCVSIILHNQIRGTNSTPGFTTDIVIRSVDNLGIDMSGKTVIVDNYYGSIGLVEQLTLKFQCFLVSTIRSNRIPTEIITEIEISEYKHNNVDGTLFMPYKFHQISPGVFIFQINDINTFQLLVSNPYLVTVFQPVLEPSTNLNLPNEQRGSEQAVIYNICAVHNAKVSRRQAGYYDLYIDTHEITKRIPASARYYNLFMKGVD